MKGLVESAFKFFNRLYKLEKGTEPGRANLLCFFGLLFLVGLLYGGERAVAFVSSVFGSDSSALNPLPVVIFLGLILMFCVWILYLVWRDQRS